MDDCAEGAVCAGFLVPVLNHIHTLKLRVKLSLNRRHKSHRQNYENYQEYNRQDEIALNPTHETFFHINTKYQKHDPHEKKTQLIPSSKKKKKKRRKKRKKEKREKKKKKDAKNNNSNNNSNREE